MTTVKNGALELLAAQLKAEAEEAGPLTRHRCNECGERSPLGTEYDCEVWFTLHACKVEPTEIPFKLRKREDFPCEHEMVQAGCEGADGRWPIHRCLRCGEEVIG